MKEKIHMPLNELESKLAISNKKMTSSNVIEPKENSKVEYLVFKIFL